jgi:hypothetical protein
MNQEMAVHAWTSGGVLLLDNNPVKRFAESEKNIPTACPRLWLIVADHRMTTGLALLALPYNRP